MSESPVAVVTGASSGIGKALVETLLSDGYSVVACARTINSVFSPTDRLCCLNLDLLDNTSARTLLTSIKWRGWCA